MKAMGLRIQCIFLALLPGTRTKASIYLKMLSGDKGFEALRFLYKRAINDASEREAILWAYGEYTKLQEIKAITERRIGVPDGRMTIETRNRIDRLIAASVSEERRHREETMQMIILPIA